MDAAEFSNQFDLLYNNITSNQAAGLNEYEKSVFLTKAQNELVLNYFNPKSEGNTVKEGFDDSAIRQMDFSNLINTFSASPVTNVSPTIDPRAKVFRIADSNRVLIIINEQIGLIPASSSMSYRRVVYEDSSDPSLGMTWEETTLGSGDVVSGIVTSTTELPDPSTVDVGTIYAINSSTISAVRQVVPIQYTEYMRLMSKPFKEPLKWQAWRLLRNSSGTKYAEIVLTSADTTRYKGYQYMCRYVKRPKPIILTVFKNTLGEDLTIDGYNGSESVYEKDTTNTTLIKNPCELDEITHEAILQRAVELAKVAWEGDVNQLQAHITSGQRSE